MPLASDIVFSQARYHRAVSSSVARMMRVLATATWSAVDTVSGSLGASRRAVEMPGGEPVRRVCPGCRPVPEHCAGAIEAARSMVPICSAQEEANAGSGAMTRGRIARMG